MSAPTDVTRWGSISESNAIDARAKLAECIEALDHGDLRFAAALCQSAASKLRTASVFAYVDRSERHAEAEPALVVKPADSLYVLRLPIALLNRLANACIDTVGDLLERSEVDLWRTRGVGRKSITAIKGRLTLAGLALRDAPLDPGP